MNQSLPLLSLRLDLPQGQKLQILGGDVDPLVEASLLVIRPVLPYRRFALELNLAVHFLLQFLEVGLECALPLRQNAHIFRFPLVLQHDVVHLLLLQIPVARQSRNLRLRLVHLVVKPLLLLLKALQLVVLFVQIRIVAPNLLTDLFRLHLVLLDPLQEGVLLHLQVVGVQLLGDRVVLLLQLLELVDLRQLVGELLVLLLELVRFRVQSLLLLHVRVVVLLTRIYLPLNFVPSNSHVLLLIRLALYLVVDSVHIGPQVQIIFLVQELLPCLLVLTGGRTPALATHLVHDLLVLLLIYLNALLLLF